MAYNNYFPQYYPQFQPVINTQIPQPSQTQQVQNTNIIWVSGEAGAKSYLVAPNTTVQLWDSEAQVIYLKSADASGMPSMKIIDYTIRNSAQSQNTVPVQTQSQTDLYVTKDEFDELKAKVQQMIAKENENEPTISATKPKSGKQQ